MKKYWVIGTLVLLVTGTVGFIGVRADINRENNETALHKAKYGEGADEYLQQYIEWSKLPADERLENPWGQGKYGGVSIQQKLQQQQPGRLRADISDLATGLKAPAVLADVLYGANWRQAVEQYKKRTATRENIKIASSVSFIAGLIVMIGYAGTCTVRKFNSTAKKSSNKAQTHDDTEIETETQTDHETETNLVSEIIESGNTETPETTEPAPIGLLQKNSLSDGVKTFELKEKLRSKASALAPETTTSATMQISDKVSTLMSTAPVSQDLTELTQEVSAIRQFAAEQQDRVRQLQDGYDWGIIKRFCLRVIRCIDNMDERIDKLSDSGEDTQCLEDVRDELIFSLESSGVEQFKPDINSSYRGLEKRVEAVKGRVPADQPDLVGKIAIIVRPGYQYVVDDNDAKIVRCAQVKLYGETS